VTRVEENGRTGHACCRRVGVEHRADSERCRRDTCKYQDIAP
jgi:hypothetical protein